jgi:hypothetical protein
VKAAEARAAASTGLAIATLGSAVIVVPAALRAAGGGAGLLVAWVALWGSAALMIAPVAAAWRLARPLSRSAWSLPLGLALSLAPLMLFARVLKVATHHRPLGGATFAIVATLLVLGATAVAARLIAWSAGREGALAQAPRVIAALSLALGLVLALPALGAELRGSVLDGLLCVVLAAVGAFVPARQLVARIGPALWVVVVVAGLGWGLGAVQTRGVLADQAPVLTGLSGWLRPVDPR